MLARKILQQMLGLGKTNTTDATAAAEKRALGIFTGLQDGKLDRSQLTEFCNAYFTDEAVMDFSSSLKPLGVPSSFKQLDEELRGGMRFRIFEASFPDRKLRVTVFEEPDGKLEQYLVNASGS